jgi:hypothetical protein
VSVCKNQIGRYITLDSKCLNAFDDRVRSRQFSEAPAFDDKTRSKVKETVGALDISSGTEAYGREATRFGAVGGRIIFINLTIRTKRGTAVFFIIELVSKDDFTRTEEIGDTILCRKLFNHMTT